MKRLITAIIVLLSLAAAPLTAGCSWFKHEATVAENAVIDCAKAEATLADAGRDVYTVFIDIASQFAVGVANGDVLTVIENLAVTYGRPIVACVIKTIAAPPGGSGSGSGSSAPSTADDAQDPFTAAARAVIAHEGWTFK